MRRLGYGVDMVLDEHQLKFDQYLVTGCLIGIHLAIYKILNPYIFIIFAAYLYLND